MRSESDESELIKAALRGELIEVCICQPGFAGVACEMAVKDCAVDDDGKRMMCNNGVPCAVEDVVNGEEIYTCDCSLARAASTFANAMCRKPSTEYCGVEGLSITNSFCTNGGSCVSNLNGSGGIATGEVPHQ